MTPRGRKSHSGRDLQAKSGSKPIAIPNLCFNTVSVRCGLQLLLLSNERSLVFCIICCFELQSCLERYKVPRINRDRSHCISAVRFIITLKGFQSNSVCAWIKLRYNNFQRYFCKLNAMQRRYNKIQPHHPLYALTVALFLIPLSA